MPKAVEIKRIKSIAEKGSQTYDDFVAGEDIVKLAQQKGWDGKGTKPRVQPQYEHPDTVQKAAQFLRTPKISKGK